MIYYELWDIESRNLLGTSDSNSEILSTVRDLIALNGQAVAEGLMLGWGDTEDPSRGGEIASGAGLAELARTEAAA